MEINFTMSSIIVKGNKQLKENMRIEIRDIIKHLGLSYASRGSLWKKHPYVDQGHYDVPLEWVTFGDPRVPTYGYTFGKMSSEVGLIFITIPATGVQTACFQ